MQGMREFGNALVVALISVSLMVGALSISLVEFVPVAAPTATNAVFASPGPLTSTPTSLPTLTPTIGLESPTPTITATFTNTATPPASCPPPPGWVNQIIIQAGDTIDIIALRYRVSKDELRSANCLPSDFLVTGSKLYVPLSPTSTVAACIPGAVGWVRSYVVKLGDTIYAIATSHYTTADLLKAINCKSTDMIYPNDILWVPDVATRTPSPTPLPGYTTTPYPTTVQLTETAIPLPFTLTPSPTDTPLPPTTAPTFTALPTLTASPTAFPTPTP